MRSMIFAYLALRCSSLRSAISNIYLPTKSSLSLSGGILLRIDWYARALDTSLALSPSSRCFLLSGRLQSPLIIVRRLKRAGPHLGSAAPSSTPRGITTALQLDQGFLADVQVGESRRHGVSELQTLEVTCSSKARDLEERASQKLRARKQLLRLRL